MSILLVCNILQRIPLTVLQEDIFYKARWNKSKLTKAVVALYRVSKTICIVIKLTPENYNQSFN